MSRTIVGAAMLVIVESIRSSTSAISTMARISRSRVVSRPAGDSGGGGTAASGAGGRADRPRASSGRALSLVVVTGSSLSAEIRSGVATMAGPRGGGWSRRGCRSAMFRARRLEDAVDQHAEAPGEPVRSRTGHQLLGAERGQVRVSGGRRRAQGRRDRVLLVRGVDSPLAGALLGRGRRRE